MKFYAITFALILAATYSNVLALTIAALIISFFVYGFYCLITKDWIDVYKRPPDESPLYTNGKFRWFGRFVKASSDE